jgi:GrpB-like predicted nucleotidyltransferase (UPF0157 family)
MKLIVADYSPAWPGLFEEEKRLLETVVPAGVGVIEHVGSTSVPGLAAKPIIDIMIGLHDFSTVDALVPAIVALGYEYIPKYEDVMPYRRYFRRMLGEAHTHHIHMVATGTEFWDRHLLFRDYLRANPDASDRYASLKRMLAEREWNDMNDYAAAKTDFIRGIENEAMQASREQ